MDAHDLAVPKYPQVQLSRIGDKATGFQEWPKE
jgi:hypothetical protein